MCISHAASLPSEVVFSQTWHDLPIVLLAVASSLYIHVWLICSRVHDWLCDAIPSVEVSMNKYYRKRLQQKRVRLVLFKSYCLLLQLLLPCR